MSEELKPVKCGCGGEARPQQTYNGDWYVVCEKCIMCSGHYHTKSNAISAWNKAMGAKDINVPDKERTAKVENISDYHLPINDYCFIKKGDCGNCGFVATEGDKYCRECGARLEWE